MHGVRGISSAVYVGVMGSSKGAAPSAEAELEALRGLRAELPSWPSYSRAAFLTAMVATAFARPAFLFASFWALFSLYLGSMRGMAGASDGRGRAVFLGNRRPRPRRHGREGAGPHGGAGDARAGRAGRADVLKPPGHILALCMGVHARLGAAPTQDSDGQACVYHEMPIELLPRIAAAGHSPSGAYLHMGEGLLRMVAARLCAA